MRDYIVSVINRYKWLQVRGLQYSQSVNIPLEKVYVALHVDKTHPFERAQFQNARLHYFEKHLASGEFLPEDVLHKLHASLGHAHKSHITDYPPVKIGSDGGAWSARGYAILTARDIMTVPL